MTFSDMNFLFRKESKKRACGRAQLVGWFVVFRFNGPLRQNFCLYRVVSRRERERERERERVRERERERKKREMIDERINF